MSVMISANQNWSHQITFSCHPMRVEFRGSKPILTFNFADLFLACKATDSIYHDGLLINIEIN